MVCDSKGWNVTVLYSKGIVIVGHNLIFVLYNLFGCFHLLLATRKTVCWSYFHTEKKVLELSFVVSKTWVKTSKILHLLVPYIIEEIYLWKNMEIEKKICTCAYSFSLVNEV